MIDFTKEGRVGDKVADLNSEEGVITGLEHNERYPVIVKYRDGTCQSYTAVGKGHISDKIPSITFANGSIRIDQGTPPSRETEELYCGLTKKQWKRIIHEEFMLGFSDEGVKQAKNSTCIDTLRCFPGDGEGLFLAKDGTVCKYAAIPDMKGICKPHFGGACPTKHEGLIAVKLRNGTWINTSFVGKYDVWSWRDGGGRNADIMEYIELP